MRHTESANADLARLQLQHLRKRSLECSSGLRRVDIDPYAIADRIEASPVSG